MIKHRGTVEKKYEEKKRVNVSQNWKKEERILTNRKRKEIIKLIVWKGIVWEKKIKNIV